MPGAAMPLAQSGQVLWVTGSSNGALVGSTWIGGNGAASSVSMPLASTYRCGVKASIAHHVCPVYDLRFALRFMPKRLRLGFDTNRTDLRGGDRSVALASCMSYRSPGTRRGGALPAPPRLLDCSVRPT